MKEKIIQFTNKYISFFENEYRRSERAYYQFFDTEEFAQDCRALGFEMDCGHSFTEAYGQEAWQNAQFIKDNIEKIKDINIIGSGLFSKWRYYNHWSYSHANDDVIEWFLVLLRRLKELSEPEQQR